MPVARVRDLHDDDLDQVVCVWEEAFDEQRRAARRGFSYKSGISNRFAVAVPLPD
jgi:hypothetical protein